MKRLVLLAATWMLVLETLVWSAPKLSQEKAVVEKTIRDSIGWALTKDRPLLESVMTQDERLFLFQPDSKSTIVGWDQFVKQFDFWMDPRFKATRFDLRDLHFNLSPSGDFAWFSALLDDLGEWDGKPIGWKDTRWTGVLEKKNKQWRLVQMHFSFASDKIQKTPSALAPAEASSPVPDAYQEDRRQLGVLVKEEKFQQAADLLESMLKKHPDHFLANSYNAAYVYGRMGRFDEGLRLLEGALAKELWFGQWDFEDNAWDGFRALPGFQQVVERSRLSQVEVAKTATMKLEVSLPAGYNPAQSYPLFLALHGGGENLADFRPHWTSERLRKEFLVAYVQSSQVANMTGFHWQDIDITTRDLNAAIQQLTLKYSIDRSQILVGGFSSGGFAALTVSLKGLLPTRGFVALCPAPPDSITQDDIRKAREQGIRGTIITSEMDGRLAKQRELANRLRDAGFQYQFRVTPQIGHWYPDDLAARIDQALEHIEGK